MVLITNQNQFEIYSIQQSMTTEKQSWNDLHDDDSDEEVHQINQDQHHQTDTKQVKKIQKQEFQERKQYNPRDNRREEREKLKQEQLKLLDQVQNNQVWIFIFKNQNPQLQTVVKQIPVLKLFIQQKGWDLKMSKQDAKKLLMYGFKPKRVFARIVVGKRNFPRQDDRDRREDRGNRGNNRGGDRERRKYVQKQESTVTNQYTFQKNRRNKRDQEGGEKNRDQEKERERKPVNKYKNDPLFQGLGNFRNKQLPNREQNQLVKEREPEKQEQRKGQVLTRNKYKQKQSVQQRNDREDESPDVITSSTQERPKRRVQKEGKSKKTSNNPFDLLS